MIARTARVAAPVALLGVAAAAGILVGSVTLDPWEVARSLAGSLPADATASLIVRQVRLPRVLTAGGAGATLAVVGVLMQTVFRNPLAGPGVLGVTGGAGVGVALALFLGLGPGVSIPSFVGALVGAGAVVAFMVALHRLFPHPVVLLLAGLLMSYAASALTTVLMAGASADGLQRFIAWGFGSFARPMDLWAVVLPAVAALAVVGVAALASRLDAMLLGAAYARSMGVNARAMNASVLVGCGAATALVTALTGPISFVGVAVPHLARGWLHASDHRRVVPTAALLGSTLTIAADLLSRLPANGGVLPVNAVLALLGVPVVAVVVFSRSSGGVGI